jgi:hypothetical protein
VAGIIACRVTPDLPPPSAEPARWTERRRGVVFVAVWLVCGVLAALLISVVERPNQALYSRLQRHGVVVAARVTRTEPTNHNTVYYSFVSGGRRYLSSDRSDPPNPIASRLAPGDHVHVVYDALDPSVSCACDPRREASSAQWWRQLIGGLFLAAIVAVVVTLGIERRGLAPGRRAGRK